MENPEYFLKNHEVINLEIIHNVVRGDPMLEIVREYSKDLLLRTSKSIIVQVGNRVARKCFLD